MWPAFFLEALTIKLLGRPPARNQGEPLPANFKLSYVKKNSVILYCFGVLYSFTSPERTYPLGRCSKVTVTVGTY